MYKSGLRKTFLIDRFYGTLITAAVLLVLAGYFWFRPLQSTGPALWEFLPYAFAIMSFLAIWLAFQAKDFSEKYRELFIQELAVGLQVTGFQIRWDEIESYEYVSKGSFRKKKFGQSVFNRRWSEEMTNKMLFLHLTKEAAQRYKSYPDLRRVTRSWEDARAIQVNSFIFETDNAFDRFVALVATKVKAHPNSWSLETK